MTIVWKLSIWITTSFHKHSTLCSLTTSDSQFHEYFISLPAYLKNTILRHTTNSTEAAHIFTVMRCVYCKVVDDKNHLYESARLFSPVFSFHPNRSMYFYLPSVFIHARKLSTLSSPLNCHLTVPFFSHYLYLQKQQSVYFLFTSTIIQSIEFNNTLTHA
jgi:hypothetical protein